MPLSAKSTPNASYSTGFQPTPTPTVSRPPDSRSTCAACLATNTVCRCGNTNTLIINSRAVTPARYAKAVSGSWNASSTL
ncbi:Uncharacterised protein [Mycobacteroides abscessus subsp. abscessus]|nr:Uncharacterised protein [Mycobacteroides abscessus subsp. abscessus]